MLKFFLVIFFFSFYSCDGFRVKKYTPNEFINHAEIKKESYNKDGIEILKQLKGSLFKHQDFFNNKAYFDSTQLILDSIIYSPDFSKLAVFIIVKNPTYRQIVPDEKYDWYYDATCYLGVKRNDTINLFWMGPNFSNSYDKKELSKLIRDSYFTEFATKDTVGAFTYKYNLNDIRFWNSPIWKKIEEEKIKKKEFEEEKKNHPENVYEPRR
jgi:hypothetical protein